MSFGSNFKDKKENFFTLLVTHPPFSQLGNVDRNILRSTPGYLTHRTYCIETANFIRRMLIIDAVNKFKHNKGIFFSSQRRTVLSTANSVMTVLLRAIARESPVDMLYSVVLTFHN